MDKPQNNSASSPGYETRDANVRGVFDFLIILGLVIAGTILVCWGMFRYFAKEQAAVPITSPFDDVRQLPLGPELQVDPRRDWLRYREQQQQSLESYQWENRSAGIVRVPIERAMDLLVQKGLPVQGAAEPQSGSATAKTTSEGAKKSAPETGQKP